jgi:nitrate reductase delta subunit
MKTFKVLAALLDYPRQELLDALGELAAVLDAERLLNLERRRRLDALFTALRGADVIGLQEEYVGLFDRVRSLSLHLFEHVHGESRDRGQAMVDLGRLYEEQGLLLGAGELPDFLPAFLEYLSFLPLDKARELLADSAHILGALGARLAKRGSPYAAVFEALVALSGEKVATAVVDEAEIRREDDRATLDKLWEEAPAFGSKSGEAGVSVIQFHKGAAR